MLEIERQRKSRLDLDDGLDAFGLVGLLLVDGGHFVRRGWVLSKLEEAEDSSFLARSRMELPPDSAVGSVVRRASSSGVFDFLWDRVPSAIVTGGIVISSSRLSGLGVSFCSLDVGRAVISSKPLSVLLQDICRSRLYFAVGLVAMVVRYGDQLTSDEVIKTWPGDQVKTDCPSKDDFTGEGDWSGCSRILDWFLTSAFSV